uniref:Uncharacterized protein n=1 Tax=Populus davidiana TaxID=266767 RepID=A0A6M2F250_9ROSI
MQLSIPGLTIPLMFPIPGKQYALISPSIIYFTSNSYGTHKPKQHIFYKSPWPNHIKYAFFFSSSIFGFLQLGIEILVGFYFQFSNIRFMNHHGEKHRRKR